MPLLFRKRNISRKTSATRVCVTALVIVHWLRALTIGQTWPAHNTRFFGVTLKSIILEFSSIMYLTLAGGHSKSNLVLAWY